MSCAGVVAAVLCGTAGAGEAGKEPLALSIIGGALEEVVVGIRGDVALPRRPMRPPTGVIIVGVSREDRGVEGVVGVVG